MEIKKIFQLVFCKNNILRVLLFLALMFILLLEGVFLGVMTPFYEDFDLFGLLVMIFTIIIYDVIVVKKFSIVNNKIEKIINLSLFILSNFIIMFTFFKIVSSSHLSIFFQLIWEPRLEGLLPGLRGLTPYFFVLPILAGLIYIFIYYKITKNSIYSHVTKAFIVYSFLLSLLMFNWNFYEYIMDNLLDFLYYAVNEPDMWRFVLIISFFLLSLLILHVYSKIKTRDFTLRKTEKTVLIIIILTLIFIVITSLVFQYKERLELIEECNNKNQIDRSAEFIDGKCIIIEYGSIFIDDIDSIT